MNIWAFARFTIFQAMVWRVIKADPWRFVPSEKCTKLQNDSCLEWTLLCVAENRCFASFLSGLNGFTVKFICRRIKWDRSFFFYWYSDVEAKKKFWVPGWPPWEWGQIGERECTLCENENSCINIMFFSGVSLIWFLLDYFKNYSMSDFTWAVLCRSEELTWKRV